MTTTTQTQNLIPPLSVLTQGGPWPGATSPIRQDTMANEAVFTDEQIARFKAGQVDKSVLPTLASLMRAAESCLEWYQRPFASLLLSVPVEKPVTAPAAAIEVTRAVA